VMADARNILKICLRGLDDIRLRTLAEHVKKKTPILCGCDKAGDFFVYDGRCDPVILACYKNGYPQQEAIHSELHPDVQLIYEKVAERVPDSGYACALEEATQWDIWQVVNELTKERRMLIE